MKKSIHSDNKYHKHDWVYNNGKSTLYIDGRCYTKKDSISVSYWAREPLKIECKRRTK